MYITEQLHQRTFYPMTNKEYVCLMVSIYMIHGTVLLK